LIRKLGGLGYGRSNGDTWPWMPWRRREREKRYVLGCKLKGIVGIL